MSVENISGRIIVAEYPGLREKLRWVSLKFRQNCPFCTASARKDGSRLVQIGLQAASWH